MAQQPQIIWEQGSAYDLFVSLWIIHRPDEFGLRPSWAAGVRSRLPLPLRDVLEQSQVFINVPLNWVYTLPQPKDAQTALDTLNALPPEDRLPALVFDQKLDERSIAYREFLLALDGKQRLTSNIEKEIKGFFTKSKKATKAFNRALFDAWSNRASFGEQFTKALEVYVENFFLEEEARIIPAQAEALKNAQQRAKGEDLLSILEDLSAGVRMDWASGVSELILAPSFWGSPFVFFDALDEDTGIILFGGRPKGETLVPGELVPEDLLNALKALADPTRLRILRYLQEEPRTPSELAKILRLRPPTVIHHLRSLRLAGLVHVTVSPKSDRRYAYRNEGLGETMKTLEVFISGD
jgi:DNA-binding transcriptional ArsR family regulator